MHPSRDCRDCTFRSPLFNFLTSDQLLLVHQHKHTVKFNEGETIVKHRCYFIEGTLQNNAERGLAIVADTVKPYVIRTPSGSPVRIRRGVRSGPMGPALGGPGAPEEESWEGTEVGLTG